MNREQERALGFAAILTAYANGEEIEFINNFSHGWKPLPKDPMWAFSCGEYRIKPQPRTVFINEYPNGEFSTWPTRDDADRNRSADRIACHEVTLPPAV